MTIHRRLNQACLGGNHVTWWIIKTMLDAGWTIPLSGSGTGGLYATSNVFDTTQSPVQYSLLGPNGVGVGSEPWGYPSCWVVLEDPSGNRQVLIKRGATASDAGDETWHCRYSPAGSFGSGQTAGVDWDEDTTPLAPDEFNIHGADAGAAIFLIGGSSSVLQVAADDTPSPAGEYGVVALDFIPTNVQHAAFILDDYRGLGLGHPHPLGVWMNERHDPWSPTYISGTGVSDGPRVPVGVGTSAVYPRQSYYLHWRFSGTQKIPGSGVVDADGSERAFAIPVGFVSTEACMGVSRWMYWAAVSGRGYPDTANSQQHLFVNDVVFKDLLDGATTPTSI